MLDSAAFEADLATALSEPDPATRAEKLLALADRIEKGGGDYVLDNLRAVTDGLDDIERVIADVRRDVEGISREMNQGRLPRETGRYTMKSHAGDLAAKAQGVKFLVERVFA